MLKISGITKAFQDGADKQNQVLRGVDLSVAAGDFIAVKGASGSGKTTLLSILGTLLTPDTGSYRLNGDEIFAAGVDYSRIRNQQIGFVFQDHRLLPQCTVHENILLPTLAFQLSATPDQLGYVNRLMDITGITGIADQYPSTISGGEASRTALCRALIMQPLLILADEPTGQLDAVNALNIAALLAEINKTLHTTIVMVTHSDEVSAKANQVRTLKDGILH